MLQQNSSKNFWQLECCCKSRRARAEQESEGQEDMGGKRLNPEEAIKQIREMAEKLGKTPSMLEFDGQPGHYSSRTIAKYYGSWTAAMIAAGLEPNTNHWK